MKERIVIAMSGGVDSSTAAALLKEEGYDVVGITMKVWDYLPKDCNNFGSCCSPEDIADARAVADKLNIPYYVMNLEAEFKKEVIDYFINAYLNGLTPNPCIPCNNRLKFHYLLKKAATFGAGKVATGHYASLNLDDLGRPVLKRGADKDKDQSYFLFNLTHEQLKKTLLPLGGYTKTKIRTMASSLGLNVAQKKDSQEICFIPDNDYPRFIKETIGDAPFVEGDIVTIKGDVLGRHKGIIYYTVGQRKGLNIAYKHPLYVIRIDKKNNEIIVGAKEDLLKKEMIVGDVHWLIDLKDNKKIVADIQIRYRHIASPGKIYLQENNTVKIIFDSPQKAIAPGQAAVFYSEEQVLGGGWIQ